MKHKEVSGDWLEPFVFGKFREAACTACFVLYFSSVSPDNVWASILNKGTNISFYIFWFIIQYSPPIQPLAYNLFSL